MLFLSILLFIFIDLSEAQSQSIYQDIDQIVERHHQTGAFHGNIEVRNEGQVIYKRSLGIANDAFDIPNDDRSRFMIASISKQFTAAAILKLAEQGLISIDDLYSKYVPLKNGHIKTMEKWDSFTIRDLLTHRAGLIRDVREVDSYNPETYAPMLAAVVDDMLSGHNVFYKTKPISGKYSNFGYMLLAYLVQTVTHSDFHHYLLENILAPLEMRSTGQYHRMFNIKYLVEGYNYLDGVGELRKRCCYDATSYVGSHGLYSDIDDLMLWLDNLISAQPVALSRESIDLMMQSQGAMAYQEASYGFGFFIDEVNGYKRVWHDGVESGYLSLVSMVPKLGIQIVILGNRHTSAVAYGDVYTRAMNDEIINLLTEEKEPMAIGWVSEP